MHYQYNPIKTVKSNVIGKLNMLVLARRVGARILQASTSEVYGRAIVADALGLSLDLIQRFELSPASASILILQGHDRRILQLNYTAGWPEYLVRGSA